MYSEKIKKYNFLHIHTTDTIGGAAISNYRFHKALLDKGYGSHILCGRKYSFDETVTPIVPGKYGWVINKFVGKIFNNLGLQSFGYPSSFFIRFSKWIDWADVVILRNLHGWYFSIGILPWLARKKPIIWRLPDMWALTGHCAYSYDCQRWRIGCGRCPHLDEYPQLLFDTTHFLWERKKRIYKRLGNRLIIVTPSIWLKKLVEQSPLTKDFRCEYIPTGVDLDIFKPGLRKEARKILGIDEKEKVVMFSSINLEDRRKGGDLVERMVREIYKKISGLVLVVLGFRGERLRFPEGIRIINVGFVGEDRFLSVCYNASDVFLSLSRADNLPNTLVEASACGTSVVTLNSGGCKEIVENGYNGYVVDDLDDFIKATCRVLNDSKLRERFGLNGRELAVKNFSMEAQVSAYLKLVDAFLL